MSWLQSIRTSAGTSIGEVAAGMSEPTKPAGPLSVEEARARIVAAADACLRDGEPVDLGFQRLSRRPGQRQNHSAVLLGEGMCEEPPVRVRFKMRPLIIFAPVVFRKARCENCPVKVRIRFVQSKHRPHGGTQEQQSADKRRYRISSHA
jgi:hypothetical protein